MLLRTLRLDNVKCFAQGTAIDFTVGKSKSEPPHRWVVVYGNNGLGKSTLLRAIAIALTGQPALNFLLPSADGWVRGTQKTASIEVEFTRNDSKGTADVISGQRKKPIKVSWTIVGRRSTPIRGKRVPAGSVVLNPQDDWELFENYIATDKARHGWLLCGYGPLRRLTGASSDIAEQVAEHGRAARLITLFHEKAALTLAERWLIQLDHEASKNSNNAERLWAVQTMLDKSLHHCGVKLGAIKPDGVFFKTPFSDEVAMSDLSDGCRTSLALALDLLRHVAHCFDLEKVMKLDGSNGAVTIEAEGVVLIDEIDSHLHPEWQRTIGDWLHSTFPKLQFIVASHSPLIAERVSRDDGMAVRLVRRTQGRGEVVDVECARTTSRSLTADQNLTGPNFGLRSTRDVLIDNLRAEIERLTRLVRTGTATRRDRQELSSAQLQFDFEAPVDGLGAASRRAVR